MRDSLTGLYNRFYLDDELARLQKSRLFPISLIVLDVDNLGLVNETRGHTAGDQLLVDVARLMQACFRQEDVIGRSGGDDFTAVLPQMNEKACAIVVDRFEGLVKHYNESADPPLEVLIGYGTASQGDSLEICLRDAEAMVHQRKKAKRNPGQ